ncbi:MAG: hypothetical protein VX801_01420 [Gemmatimonadota bacterium]|nr:hypothetical protein [Gemmatimonadota bacterium]
MANIAWHKGADEMAGWEYLCLSCISVDATSGSLISAPTYWDCGRQKVTLTGGALGG